MPCAALCAEGGVGGGGSCNLSGIAQRQKAVLERFARSRTGTREKRADLIAQAKEKPRQRILSTAEEARLLAAIDTPKKYRAPAAGCGRGKGRKSASNEILVLTCARSSSR